MVRTVARPPVPYGGLRARARYGATGVVVEVVVVLVAGTELVVVELAVPIGAAVVVVELVVEAGVLVVVVGAGGRPMG